MTDDIEQIKQLKARYFRLMDGKDWDAWRALFTEDVVLDVRSGAQATGSDTAGAPAIGPDAVVRAIAGGLEGIISVHQGFMPEITLPSADRAEGIWAMAYVLRAPEGAPFRTMRGYGHYHDGYRRVDGQWKIASVQLSLMLTENDTAA